MSSTVPARDRILATTIRLLADGGVAAVSTRAVVDGAGVQAPAIYRLFGDKQGLLDAAVDRGIADYLDQKRARAWPEDPVEAFRAGWDDQVDLALDNPALYRLMQEAWRRRPAETSGFDLLHRRIEAIARAGLLRVPVAEAAGLTHATGTGIALDLIATEPDERDPALSDRAREAVLAAITTVSTSPPADVVRAAVTLRAHLPAVSALTGAEAALLAEWLDRIADAPRDTASFQS